MSGTNPTTTTPAISQIIPAGGAYDVTEDLWESTPDEPGVAARTIRTRHYFNVIGWALDPHGDVHPVVLVPEDGDQHAATRVVTPRTITRDDDTGRPTRWTTVRADVITDPDLLTELREAGIA